MDIVMDKNVCLEGVMCGIGFEGVSAAVIEDTESHKFYFEMEIQNGPVEWGGPTLEIISDIIFQTPQECAEWIKKEHYGCDVYITGTPEKHSDLLTGSNCWYGSEDGMNEKLFYHDLEERAVLKYGKELGSNKTFLEMFNDVRITH